MVSKSAADDGLPTYSEHQDLSYYLDSDGKKHPIRNKQDWIRRDNHILAHMQTVMGKVPEPAKPVELKVTTLEEVRIESFTRKKISYHTISPKETVSAYLFLPKASTAKSKVPAVLCLHQTTRIGKGEPAGIGGRPNLHYALHLARRGYVTLAPDYPSFGDYNVDFEADDYISGTMRAIYDNIRAVDLLQSLPEVKADRIGCIGHSLGGHNTIFTAAFEPRIKAMVSNCGFTRFHKYYGGRLKGWTSSRYMPLINSKHKNDPDQVPFDFTEIIASFAPRPFLASAPVRDSNFEVSGVRDVIKSAMPIYKLYDAEDALQANYPDSAHDFPEDARKVAYEFLDKHLKAE
ncbi:MAG: acetylxylan esterase [Planctomycetaceae bacterium]|nr:acetylxylan esterase [Planctomycetaceae bacterium]